MFLRSKLRVQPLAIKFVMFPATTMFIQSIADIYRMNVGHYYGLLVKLTMSKFVLLRFNVYF